MQLSKYQQYPRRGSSPGQEIRAEYYNWVVGLPSLEDLRKQKLSRNSPTDGSTPVMDDTTPALQMNHDLRGTHEELIAGPIQSDALPVV